MAYVPTEMGVMEKLFISLSGLGVAVRKLPLVAAHRGRSLAVERGLHVHRIQEYCSSVRL